MPKLRSLFLVLVLTCGTVYALTPVCLAALKKISTLTTDQMAEGARIVLGGKDPTLDLKELNILIEFAIKRIKKSDKISEQEARRVVARVFIEFIRAHGENEQCLGACRFVLEALRNAKSSADIDNLIVAMKTVPQTAPPAAPAAPPVDEPDTSEKWDPLAARKLYDEWTPIPPRSPIKPPVVTDAQLVPLQARFEKLKITTVERLGDIPLNGGRPLPNLFAKYPASPTQLFAARAEMYAACKASELGETFLGVTDRGVVGALFPHYGETPSAPDLLSFVKTDSGVAYRLREVKSGYFSPQSMLKGLQQLKAGIYGLNERVPGATIDLVELVVVPRYDHDGNLPDPFSLGPPTPTGSRALLEGDKPFVITVNGKKHPVSLRVLEAPKTDRDLALFEKEKTAE